MEKIKFIIPILLLTFSSCNRTPHYNDVNACFVVTGDIHYINEPVSFVDCSQYAEEYEWNFGDGTTSNQRNANHVYTLPGTYQVSLTANGYNTTETFTDVVTVLNVINSTDLDILIKYEGTNDPVSGCEVQLYGDSTNWQNLTNPVSEVLTTGSDGIVVFTDLNPATYFIDAYKSVTGGYYMNVDGETSPLDEAVINYYDVFVQYFTSKSGRKHLSVTRLVKSSKEERDK
ncbi:MAG: PKD domain-containing protein [Bacteroidales bacterium]|nr:PKD domain-containing protein [Bacteroidales bacterium]